MFHNVDFHPIPRQVLLRQEMRFTTSLFPTAAIVLFLPSSLAGGFLATCYDVRANLKVPFNQTNPASVLRATCGNGSGGWLDTGDVFLDSCIGNINGHLACPKYVANVRFYTSNSISHTHTATECLARVTTAITTTVQVYSVALAETVLAAGQPRPCL